MFVYAQWTDQYGTAGPTNIEEAGSRKQDEDCSPRFPVCSNLGFCTVKDYFEVSQYLVLLENTFSNFKI